jgi:predicted nucleic acid-binding Zn ribbon protein
VSDKCPSCQRVLYNRRLKNCGFCGAPIPEDLRFTPEESVALEQKMADLEKERRQRQLAADKEEEEKKQREADDGGDVLPGEFGT